MKKSLTLAVLLLFFFFGSQAQIASTETDIVTFSLPGQVNSTVDSVSHSVLVEMNPGTDLSNQIATFTLSSGATAEISGTVQQSSTTSNNFNTPVSYLIKAEDVVTTQIWAVTAVIVYPEMNLASITPTNGTSANANSNISLTFSEASNLATVPSGITLNGSQSGLIAGNWTLSGNTLTFDPTNNFFAGEIITVSVTHGVENNTGSLFSPNYSWSFNVSSGLSSQNPAAFSSNKILYLNPSANSQPWGGDAADIDGDGDMDAIAVRESHYITWFENDGSGAFTEHQLPNYITNARSPRGVDLDSDGDTDIVLVSLSNDYIGWFKNDGSQNFTWIPSEITGIDSPWEIHPVDIDSDGDMDIISASYNDDKVALHLNDGDENFTSLIISNTADYAKSVYAADINDDGKIDILSASVYDDEINWYENTGAGFITHLVDNSVNGAIGVYATDLDGDGDFDIVSLGQFDNKLYWHENDGAQSFTKHTVASSFTSPQTKAIAIDIDGDNDIDLVAAAYNTNDVAWFENDGNQNFTKHSMPTAAQNPFSVVTADFDGDGDIDIMSTSITDKKVAWYENIGTPITDVNDFLSFSVPGQAGVAAIDTTAHTVNVGFMGSPDLTSLVATFEVSPGASAAISGTVQVSGTTTNNFTSSLIYTVTAGDGTTIQDWTVSTYVLSNETEVLSFQLTDQVGTSVIDSVNHTVIASFLIGFDVTSQIATFTLSSGAIATLFTVSQESGVTSNDFTNPIVYNVLSEDGTANQDWTISVNYLSNAKEIVSFSLPGQSYSNIDAVNKSVDLGLPAFVDLTGLAASFNLSPGATASIGANTQVSGTTTNDFSSLTTYTITAEDGTTTQDWTINIQALSSSTDISVFNLAGSLKPSVIDASNHEITVDFLQGTDLSTLVASYIASLGSTVTISGIEQTSGSSINNFSTTVTYNVLAEDMITEQNWTVILNQISLCDHLAGLGLECDPVESKLNVLPSLAGDGLTWENGIISVTNIVDFNAAFDERGSVIDGTGLTWNGSEIDLDVNALAGTGLSTSGSTLEFDGSDIISNDFEWDPINKKIGLKDGYASLFTKINDSSIYFSASNASDTQVGIGTSYIPTGYMLAVGGNIIANKVKVQLPAEWPDYVFEEGYDLMPLKQLSKFIADNKHLPGVPSAREVEKDGIDLGEMNAVLLKKIEELTLYSIDQEKRILQQKETVDQLIKRNAEILRDLEL